MLPNRIPIALTLFMFFSANLCLAKESDLISKASLILKEIEPNFINSPIFLNSDENFKATNKRKLLEAIDYLEKGFNVDSQNANLLYLLGIAYSFAHDLDLRGAWQKSVEYLKKAIEINPNDDKPHMVLGKNYMDAAKFDESFQEYEKVNELVPNGFALRNMAFVRMAQKRTDEAQELLKQYIKYNPKDLDTLKILNALQEGRFEKVET